MSILILSILSPAKNPHGHYSHGTPTPTSTPTPPTPTPSPTTTPLPPPSSVPLAWDAATDQTDPAAGYYFKLGFSSGGETQVTDVGNVLTYTVGVTSGTQYFFVVSAYDANRNESLPSNEVNYIAP